MSLHPLTLKSIRATADSHGNVTCGCMMDIRMAWNLCPYHQGFEDALNEVFFPDCIEGGEQP